MSTEINTTSADDAVPSVIGATRSGVTSPDTSARVSFWSAIASLLFLAALHALSPEFNPASRMVSEYALGSYNWVLALMFLTWALSCVALVFAIKSEARTVGGRIGLGFLLLAAIGMSMAAVYDVNHNLHGLAAMIGMPSLPVAAVLISVSLGRNPSWAPARGWLIWTAILTWAGLVLMNIGIFTGFSETGDAKPDAWFGWANRFLIVAYDIWLMTAAWRMTRTARTRSL